MVSAPHDVKVVTFYIWLLAFQLSKNSCGDAPQQMRLFDVVSSSQVCLKPSLDASMMLSHCDGEYTALQSSQ